MDLWVFYGRIMRVMMVLLDGFIYETYFSVNIVSMCMSEQTEICTKVGLSRLTAKLLDVFGEAMVA